MIIFNRGTHQQDIMLHHKEGNLESVKDLIDPFHEEQHPITLTQPKGTGSQPTQQIAVRDRGERLKHYRSTF